MKTMEIASTQENIRSGASVQAESKEEGKERKGKIRKGKERKGKERKGKERKGQRNTDKQTAMMEQRKQHLD